MSGVGVCSPQMGAAGVDWSSSPFGAAGAQLQSNAGCSASGKGQCRDDQKATQLSASCSLWQLLMRCCPCTRMMSTSVEETSAWDPFTPTSKILVC